MGIGDGIADIEKVLQKLRAGRAGVRRGRPPGCDDNARWPSSRVFAFDEPHRVKRPAVVVLTEAMHGHDAGMCEPAGDFRFEIEALPAAPIVRMTDLDFLEGHAPPQLGILGDVNDAESAPCMQR